MSTAASSPEIRLPLGEYIAGVQETVNPKIDECRESLEPNLRDMFAYALGGENPNRLRPGLVYMAGDTLGIPRKDLHKLALGTEIIHSTSLVMDDLPGQDNSNLRRGQEALHVKYGVGPAEVLTAAMLVKAAILLAKTDAEHDLGGHLSSRVMGLVGKMCSGQIDDLKSAGRTPEDMTEEELDGISWLKTGTAIEMSLVGAVMIGRPDGADGITRIMEDYSYHMGITYQAHDDLLDIAETSEETGKPTEIDSRNQKPTYLSVLGEAATREKALRHAEEASASLDGLPDRYDPVKLREIAAYIVRK